MLNRNDSNLHVFLLYINVLINYFIFLHIRGIGKFKELNFVDDSIMKITQDALRIDQTHHFNLFLLNIDQFKLHKLSKTKIILFPGRPNK